VSANVGFLLWFKVSLAPKCLIWSFSYIIAHYFTLLMCVLMFRCGTAVACRCPPNDETGRKTKEKSNKNPEVRASMWGASVAAVKSTKVGLCPKLHFGIFKTQLLFSLFHFASSCYLSPLSNGSFRNC
jgi:hypothetical protein